MISVNVKAKSNRIAFERQMNSKIDNSLEMIGLHGVSNITTEAPVDTGRLKASNDYEVSGLALLFYNTADYAPYVEFGTRFVMANPFMLRGINNSMAGFNRIIGESLRV